MNRKNVIKYVLAIILLGGVVYGIGFTKGYIDELQETLNEKEKVISDIGKTVETLTKQNKELNDNLINVRQENADLRDNLQKTVDEVETLKNDKEKLQSDLSSLQTEVKKLSAKKAEPVVASMPSRGKADNYKTLYMEATAYTAYCTGCSGTTTTGINLRANPDLKVIAVDPSIIPLGTKVHVDGYGYAIAGDTGGAIKGHKIDIFIPTKAAANQWGRKTVKVTVLN